ncbi:MAG: dTDP-4-dehydrorhamnose reductase [Anaerolineae bacterium]|nr:MAG: dTDP-4-dehydrorhamnose reductase [Anaerolineae bacterium]
MAGVDKLRVLVLGRRGQLGSELERLLTGRVALTAWGRDELDLSQLEFIWPAVKRVRPELVINCAGYTNVDRAEDEPEKAMLLNGRVPEELARACAGIGAKLAHISTDYVFDGETDRAYREMDAPNPLQVYGTSKLAGEQAVFSASGGAVVLRTSWLYHMGYPSFPRRVLGWARGQKRIRIVAEHVSSPTWATRLALILAESIQNGELLERQGLYHVAGAGQCSRYDWAKTTLQLDPRGDEHTHEAVEAVVAEAFGGARRPRFSALDCSKFDADFGLNRPNWKEDLLTALQGEWAVS